MSSREIKYQPYLETAHSRLLGTGDSVAMPILAGFNAAIGQAPYKEQPDIMASYIGAGYPALAEIFGSFMAGQDMEHCFSGVLSANIEAVYDQRLEDQILEARESYQKLVRYLSGQYRHINAVTSSACIAGKAALYTTYTRKISAFGLLRTEKALKLSLMAYKAQLTWKLAAVMEYANLGKSVTERRLDYDARYKEFKVKELEWDLTMFSNYVGPHMNPGGFGVVQNMEGSGLTDKEIAEQAIATTASTVAGIYFGPLAGVGVAAAIQLDMYLREEYGWKSFFYTGGLTGPGLIWDWVWSL